MTKKILGLLTFWKNKLKGDKRRPQLSMRRIVFHSEPAEDVLPDNYEFAEYVTGFDDKWVHLINECQDFRNLGIWTTETLHSIIIGHVIPGGCILITEGDELVACTGLCDYSPNADTVVLMYILVHRNHRGQGLGNAMIQRAVRICQEHGIKEIRLSTDDYRLAAINLYLRNGFHFGKQNGMKTEKLVRKVIEKLK